MPAKSSWAADEDSLFAAARAKNATIASAGNGNKIYVGGLLWDADEELLTEIFEDCGEIVDVNIIKDPVSKHCRGFAFVTFSKREGAEKAIREKDREDVDGSELRISLATEKNSSSNSSSSSSSSSGGRKRKEPEGKFGVVYERTKEIAKKEAQERWEKRQEKKESKASSAFAVLVVVSQLIGKVQFSNLGIEISDNSPSSMDSLEYGDSLMFVVGTPRAARQETPRRSDGLAILFHCESSPFLSMDACESEIMAPQFKPGMQAPMFSVADGRRFAEAVSLNDKFLLVSIPGDDSVALYLRNGRFYNSTPAIFPNPGSRSDQFGSSVALGESFAVVAAPARNGTGAIYVIPSISEFFGEISDQPATSVWRKSTKPIFSPNPVAGGHFGSHLAVDSGAAIIFVGEPDADRVSTFSRIDDDTWIHQAFIASPTSGIQFGVSMAFSSQSSSLVVGAPGEEGAVFVYKISPQSVESFAALKANLTNSNPEEFDQFGQIVSAAGLSASVWSSDGTVHAFNFNADIGWQRGGAISLNGQLISSLCMTSDFILTSNSANVTVFNRLPMASASSTALDLSLTAVSPSVDSLIPVVLNPSSTTPISNGDDDDAANVVESSSPFIGTSSVPVPVLIALIAIFLVGLVLLIFIVLLTRKRRRRKRRIHLTQTAGERSLTTSGSQQMSSSHRHSRRSRSSSFGAASVRRSRSTSTSGNKKALDSQYAVLSQVIADDSSSTKSSAVALPPLKSAIASADYASFELDAGKESISESSKGTAAGSCAYGDVNELGLGVIYDSSFPPDDPYAKLKTKHDESSASDQYQLMEMGDGVENTSSSKVEQLDVDVGVDKQ